MADPADPRWSNAQAQSRLTTPVGYMANLLMDPFKSGGVVNQVKGTAGNGDYYSYHGFVCPELNKAHKRLYGQGYTWSLDSPGPSRATAGNVIGALDNNPTPGTGEVAYDPTNGSVSWGMIIRSNKGIFTAPGT